MESMRREAHKNIGTGVKNSDDPSDLSNRRTWFAAGLGPVT